MKEENGNTHNQPTDSSQSAGVEKTTSAQKVESNRKNAQKSTGPKTDAGRAQSSQNAFRHGFFSKRVHGTAEQLAQDGADYQELLNGLREHYQPQGYFENLLVEKIAIGYLRSVRLFKHEQRVLGCQNPFELRSASSLPRYQTSIERQIAKDIERLEALQANRKAKGGSDQADEEVDAGDDAEITVSAITPAELPAPSPSGAEKIAETNPNSSEPTARISQPGMMEDARS
jgi:hypothetical protein